jgi:K+-sensing histidine kinase KdpD
VHEEEQDDAQENLELAKSLGAIVVWVKGSDPAAALIDFVPE